jgi:hypothetical protein
LERELLGMKEMSVGKRETEVLKQSFEKEVTALGKEVIVKVPFELKKYSLMMSVGKEMEEVSVTLVDFVEEEFQKYQQNSNIHLSKILLQRIFCLWMRSMQKSNEIERELQ